MLPSRFVRWTSRVLGDRGAEFADLPVELGVRPGDLENLAIWK
jgi:hypothetical protein